MSLSEKKFQSGIFDKSHSQHVFLEFSRSSQGDQASVLAAIKALASLSLGDTVMVIAFGPDLWSALGGGFSFPAFSMEGRVPATQGDLFVWLQDSDRGNLFDAAMGVQKCLCDNFNTQLELNGFVYHDSRDLTGFVDGIGNPAGENALQAAIVADGHPGAGGSFVISQKWVHDLKAFNRLDVTAQEQVFGRTKPDAVEFSEEDMPENSHVGRTDISRDGVAQKIWRRSAPYGTTGEYGLYFLAFSCELDRFDYLLRNMYGMNGDGVRDHMLDFTTPVTSSWWYAPTREWLDAL